MDGGSPLEHITNIWQKNVINEQAVMSLIHKMVISIAFFFFCRYCILYHPLNMILLKEIYNDPRELKCQRAWESMQACQLRKKLS